MHRSTPCVITATSKLVVAKVLAAALLFASGALVAQDSKPASNPAARAEITTASGLKYRILKKGKEGASPIMGDKVKVHYTGWLTDGKEFDSSRKRGQPSEFLLGRVIKGWNEGLKLMTPGARYKFTIPSALAYGENGQRGVIPPNADLIFDVELLSFTGPGISFRKGNPKAQKTTKSGLKYEILKEGKGARLSKNQCFGLAYALWNDKGELLNCTEFYNDLIVGTISSMHMPFLKEAPLLLQQGARLRFEVPKALGGPLHTGMMVWELELLRIYTPPKFSMSAADKTKKTPSGLQYEILKEGKGKMPKTSNQVMVHYSGWLTDGTSFDSSYERR